ncbi:type VII secretion protein EccE [Kribbella sp. NPDC026611]|uniref:type VII secretion protein EccE n=1 Tax=Kribbella sp. NPDC026611 TaxID=3154911 RepID=UPI0033D1AFD3
MNPTGPAAYGAAPAYQPQAGYAAAAATMPQATAVGTPAAQPRPPATRRLVASAAVAKPPEQRLHVHTEPPVTTPDGDSVQRPDHAVRVGQIVCWQLALVAVGAATAGSRTVLVLTSLAGLSLILLTTVRIRGLWLYRWAALLLVFVLRHRKHDLSDDIAIRLVSTFHGRTTADEVVVREQPYGVLSRPAGASVALRLGPDAQHRLLPQLASLADTIEEQPVSIGVQLVLHTGVKQGPQPRVWLAVAAERTPEIATDEQLHQVLANTVRRLVRRFDRERVESTPLDGSDVLSSIGALAHANAGRGQIAERWTSWSCGPVRQLTVRLAGSASLPSATTRALVGTLLGTATGAAQTIAVTVTGRPAARHDVVLRLAAAHPATLDTALAVLTTLARSFGVEPERLDGRHATGVAVTLPLGVPLP